MVVIPSVKIKIVKTKEQLVRELEKVESARLRDQASLHNTETLYRLLVENSLGLMCTHDLDGVLLSINPAAAQSLGYRPEDGIGRNLRDFLAPSVRHLFAEYLQRIQQVGYDNGTMRLTAADGSDRLWAYRNILYQEPGAGPLVLGHALDITSRVQAEAAVQLRNQVLAMATHDLRSPLTTIAGYAELIELRLRSGRAIDSDWLLAHLQSLQNAVTGMLATIDELSDVAQLHMGQALDLQLETVDLVALTHLVVNDAHVRRDDTLINMTAPLSPLYVRGDRARLTRVLQNVLDNATKYSPPYTTIDVEVVTDDRSGYIVVRDSGIGIPATELPRIFEPFYRASSARKTRGMGLGLAGARSIIEQHGGNIVLESIEGQGTTVTIRLPLPT